MPFGVRIISTARRAHPPQAASTLDDDKSMIYPIDLRADLVLPKKQLQIGARVESGAQALA